VPGDAVQRRLAVRRAGLAAEHHVPIPIFTFQFERGALSPHPERAPAATLCVEEVEAGSRVARGARPGFPQHAAAEDRLDSIAPDAIAVSDISNVPLADPEVEVLGPGIGAVCRTGSLPRRGSEHGHDAGNSQSRSVVHGDRPFPF
jgi:hypothetical protein